MEEKSARMVCTAQVFSDLHSSLQHSSGIRSLQKYSRFLLRKCASIFCKEDDSGAFSDENFGMQLKSDEESLKLSGSELKAFCKQTWLRHLWQKIFFL